MHDNNQNEEIELDLTQIIQFIFKKLWLIIIGLLVGSIIAYSYTNAFVEPKYSSDVKLYVNSGGVSVGNVTISVSDLSLSSSLIDTYITILNTRTTLNRIIEEGELSYSTSQLSSMISATALNGTAIFQISVVSTDPYEAEHIANVIAVVLPEQIGETIADTSTIVLDYAITPAAANNNDLTSNTVLGALGGSMAVVCLLLLMYLTRQQIASVDELAALSDAPLLSVVPNFDNEKSRKKKTSKKKKGAK
ncbi:MAG: Wzz/FepE/Etk N-terminal domain-containing protein [Clostridia bacterium]